MIKIPNKQININSFSPLVCFTLCDTLCDTLCNNETDDNSISEGSRFEELFEFCKLSEFRELTDLRDFEDSVGSRDKEGVISDASHESASLFSGIEKSPCAEKNPVLFLVKSLAVCSNLSCSDLFI